MLSEKNGIYEGEMTLTLIVILRNEGSSSISKATTFQLQKILRSRYP